MRTRMATPALSVPGSLEGVQALATAVRRCVHMHARDLKKAGESDERIWAVGAWRDSPLFTDAERAALALTEAMTRLSDRPDPVPDEVYEEAARHDDELALAALILQITLINAWNRLNVATRQEAGKW